MVKNINLIFQKYFMANVVSEDNADNDKARRRFQEILQQAKREYDKINNGDDEEDEEEDDDILSRLGL